MQYMPAVLLAHAKEVRDDGTIIEISIWQLPEPLSPSEDFRRDIDDWRQP